MCRVSGDSGGGREEERKEEDEEEHEQEKRERERRGGRVSVSLVSQAHLEGVREIQEVQRCHLAPKNTSLEGIGTIEHEPVSFSSRQGAQE